MIIPIFIPHVGCPNQCIFCNQKKISGEKLASHDDVERQINKYLHLLKPERENEAAFFGGSFTGLELSLQERLFAPVDKLFADGIIRKIRVSTRPDYIDEEKLIFLKKHNVNLVELGVQSLDNAVLKLAERGHNAEAVYSAVALLKKYNFEVCIQLMVGMMGQSEQSFKETIERVIDLKPNYVRLYPMIVVKDTPLEKIFYDKEFEPMELEAAVDLGAWAWERFEENGIKVIRLGLQADEELCGGNIVAGPYHPAYGEMVYGRYYRNKLTPKIKNILELGARQIILDVPTKLESKVRGLGNCNKIYWENLGADILIRKDKNIEKIRIDADV